MNMKPYTYIKVALCAAALLIAGSASAAIVASIAGDYVDAGTMPNGWQYYASDAASGGTETLMTGNVSVGNQGATGFSNGAANGNFASIIGEGNPFEVWGGVGNNAIVGTDMVAQLGPNLNDRYVLLRYTISAQDIADNGTSGTLSGSFRNSYTIGDGVSVGIYRNNTLLWSVNSTNDGTSSLTQTEGTYNISQNFTAGDTVTFYMFSNGANQGDEIAFNGTLDLVPEPETYALIFGGLALGFVMLRRRIKG